MSFDNWFVSEHANEETLRLVTERVDRIGPVLGVGGGGLHFDTRRLAFTVEYMKRYLADGRRCVEIGSTEYLSSQVVWSFFSDRQVTGTKNDLRSERLAFEDCSIDNLIATEVVEHISDVKYVQATTLDGLFFFLEEVYRVLRIGGRALISTPNAASVWALQRILLGQPPLVYDWHFREFTPDELRQIVENVGFDVVVHNTEFVWHRWNFNPIFEFIRAQNYSLDMRGDDQFLVVEKSDQRKRKPHKLALPI